MWRRRRIRPAAKKAQWGQRACHRGFKDCGAEPINGTAVSRRMKTSAFRAPRWGLFAKMFGVLAVPLLAIIGVVGGLAAMLSGERRSRVS